MSIEKENIPDSEIQIEEILLQFDWEKVKKVMEYLDWTWEGTGVPTIYRIILEGKNILHLVARSGGVFQAGGLVARNTDGILSLAFELTSWEFVSE